MKKIICGIYFATFMLLIIVMMVLYPIMAPNLIRMIRTSGFGGPNDMYMLSVFGLIIGLSLLIPVLRQMYYWFPWLFPFVKIFFVNCAILIVGTTILNFGYQVQNPTRHTTFFILMICFMVIGRVLMCFYFHKKNVEYVGGGGR